MSTEKGGRPGREGRRPQRGLPGGMCPRCEGMGAVSDFDLTALYDDEKSLDEGALTVPGYSMDGWYGRIFARLRLRHGQADQEVHQEGARRPPLQGADQDQGRGHQPHLRGRHPQDPEVDAVQGRRGDAAAHPGVRRAGRSPSRPAPTATAPGSAGGAVVEDQGQEHRRPVRDADQRPRRVGPRARRAVGGAAARRACGTCSTRSSRSASATSRSIVPRARCRAARPSAPR